MIFNSSMAGLLSSVPFDRVRPEYGHPVWRGFDLSGRPFWGVDSFCGLYKSPVPVCDLTALEWTGNEVYLSLTGFHSFSELLLHALGVVRAWKGQMEAEFFTAPFDIFLSVDTGNEEVPPSVTVRFWAVRDGVHYVSPSPSELERFCQPVLMEQANYIL